jgi:hypothetical protein
MRLNAYSVILAMLLLICLLGCGGSTSATSPQTESIAATGGSGQNAVVGMQFATLLSATVSSNGSPVSGATVTFSAPTSGASGTFSGGMSSATATTDASGVASATFTANERAGTYAVRATVSGALTSASFSLTNSVGPPSAIVATGGSPQTAAINATFAPLLATAMDSFQNPVSGVSVTFVAPDSGASGTFSGGTNTLTVTTDATGVASVSLTANGTVGGPYTVNAAAAGVSTSASFSLTNRALILSSFSFYLSGLEVDSVVGESEPYFYALAGSVTIDENGNVLAGEQDFNGEFTSPQPSGDAITGGTLTWVNVATGQATLTLRTNDTSLGVNGVETIGVQFVNPSHALIVQFDGSATSSGSMDLQTLPSSLTGGYAFTFTQIDPRFNKSIVSGGVVSIAGTTLQNGRVDTDNWGSVTKGTAFSGIISTPDSFGRGTITGTGIASLINYYIVGPEALRLIDVDTNLTGIGSAFGQGARAGAFDNDSLGSSVFGVGGDPFATNAAVGMFTTNSGPGTFQGIADNNEAGALIQFATTIGGVYSIASNGYGSLTIAPGNLGDVSSFGIYMTDQNLNLSDPNNTASGQGGALIADLDTFLNGTGILVPQTDTSTSSFAGNYAFGAQVYTHNVPGWEFDFVGQGSVTGGVLAGNGFVSDPFHALGPNSSDSGATFSGPVVPDPSNPGRYTIGSSTSGSFFVTVPNEWGLNYYGTAAYQANGGQLFWMDEGSSLNVFLGSLQQQALGLGLPPEKRGVGKTKLTGDDSRKEKSRGRRAH